MPFLYTQTAGAKVAGAGLVAAQGIVGAINAANTEPEDEDRCTKCKRVLSSPPCTPRCSHCGGYCENDDPKRAAPGGPCCFEICQECFDRLA